MAMCNIPSSNLPTSLTLNLNSITSIRIIMFITTMSPSTMSLNSIIIMSPSSTLITLLPRHHTPKVRPSVRFSLPAPPASPACLVDLQNGPILRLAKTRQRTARNGVPNRNRKRSKSLSVNPTLLHGTLNG